MDQFIELERLSKSYRMAGEELQILHQISLSVPSGQYLSVIGPSGSGKSTLMHILGSDFPGFHLRNNSVFRDGCCAQ